MFQKLTYFQRNQIVEADNFQFQVNDILGTGSFGQVYKCVKGPKYQNEKKNSKKSEKFYALKVVSIQSFDCNPEEYVYFKREVEILQNTYHPNILRYHKCNEDLSGKYYLMVTEICNKGNLKQYIKDIGQQTKINEQQSIYTVSEETSLKFMKQILQAFYYFQKQHSGQVIVHRDIKLENILVNDNTLKLADFGFARILEQGKVLDSNVGSPKTKAPEIAMGKNYDSKVDIYSLGIILYQMLFGCFPFNKRTAIENAYLCKQNIIDFYKFGIIVSEKVQNLIKQMLEYNPNDRITFDKLFKIFNIKDLTEKEKFQYNKEQSEFEENLSQTPTHSSLQQQNEQLTQSIIDNHYLQQSQVLIKDNDKKKSKKSKDQQIEYMYLRLKLLGNHNSGKNEILANNSNAIELNKNLIRRNSQESNSQSSSEPKKHLQFNYKVKLSVTSGLEKYNSLPDQELRVDGFIILINLNDTYCAQNDNQACQTPIDTIQYWIKRINNLHGDSENILKKINVIVLKTNNQQEIKFLEEVNQVFGIQGQIFDIQNQDFQSLLIKFIQNNEKYLCEGKSLKKLIKISQLNTSEKPKSNCCGC